MVPGVESGARPIRVLLVEDNDVFRQALILLLEDQDGIEVAGAIAEGTPPWLRTASTGPTSS